MTPDHLPDKLQKVIIHGANIVSTLYAVTAGRAPCDGLLFGETVTTTTQHLRDDDDMATVTESRSVISSTLCCAGNCSFYDEAGDLRESSLEVLERQQAGPLLGWMSYRPVGSLGGGGGGSASPSLRPSMREVAVTSALLRRQLERCGGRQAVLLLLISRGSDHNGATLTWQYRCFQARLSVSSGDLSLEPVLLQTLNLGGHVGSAAYQELAAATALAAGAAAAQGVSSSSAAADAGGSGSVVLSSARHPTRITFSSACSPSPSSSSLCTSAVGAAVGGGGGSAAIAPVVALPGADPSALAAVAAGARAQVSALKQHCEALLGGLQELCGQAVAGEAAVAALRSRRDVLLAQLAQSR